MKAGCRGVHAGRGADYPERRQPLPVGDQEGDGRKAGLHRKYPDGRSREAVCGPPLDLAP